MQEKKVQTFKDRSSPRTRVFFPVRFDSGHKVFSYPHYATPQGEVVNMSDSGACFLSNVIVKPKETFKLYVKFPPGYSSVSINPYAELEVEVIWQQPCQGEKYPYKYGVKYLNPETDHLVKLKKVLDSETAKVAKKVWTSSHPHISFPSIPLSSKMLADMHPSALSVDTTNNCNLKCRHCFWDDYNEELPFSNTLSLLDSVREALKRFPSITNILWYGGEPLVSKQSISIIKAGTELIANNLVITNGTIPFHNISTKNIHFGVSLDGTRETHNFLRNANIYDKIKENIFCSLEHNIPVGLLYCINALNIDCIPRFVEEWADKGVYGIGFTMYTPLKDKEHFSYLNIQNHHRKEIIEVLMPLKDKYGPLIANSRKMIELFHHKYNKELARNCPMNLFNKKNRVYCLHMCNDGTIRIPCAIGRNACHEECRSITKMALYAANILKEKEAYHTLLKLFLSKYHYSKRKKLS